MISTEIFYEKQKNGIKITGIKGRVSEIRIPDTINGITVSEIGDYAFYTENEFLPNDKEDEISYIFIEGEKDCESDEGEAIKRIYIPDTVTKIGKYAFCGCKYLYYIHLPENLENISEYTELYKRGMEEMKTYLEALDE